VPLAPPSTTGTPTHTLRYHHSPHLSRS
jgi:hypothetical protein